MEIYVIAWIKVQSSCQDLLFSVLDLSLLESFYFYIVRKDFIIPYEKCDSNKILIQNLSSG